MAKGILFDLDGTLIETLRDLGDAVEYALEASGVSLRHTMEEYRLFVGHGVANLLERAFEGTGMDTKGLRRARRYFDEYYHAHSLDHAKVYEGLLALLEELKADGFRLAVVTNKPHVFARRMVGHCFGPALFDVIQGQVEDLPRKPDPSSALLTAKKMGCAPSDCVFVGDSETDMQTAKNAGMASIGVLWGFRSEAVLRENGADAIVSSAHALRQLLLACQEEGGGDV